MDYGAIINGAFRLAWRQKSLWIFGLFAAGGAVAGLNFSPKEDLGIDLGALGRGDLDFDQVIDSIPWLVPALAGVVFLLIAVHLLLYAICQPALIDAVNRLTRGGTYRFGDSLSVGVSLMWRTLGLILLEGLTMFGAFLLLITVAVLIGILFAAVHGLLVIPVVLAAIVAAMGIVFSVVMIFGLGYRALVARNAGILDAINEGAVLFRRETLSCLAMFGIVILLWVLTAIVVTILAVMVGMPLFVLWQSLGLGVIPSLVIVLPILWVIMLPLNGFLGTAIDAAMTLFYFRLLEPGRWVAATPEAPPGTATP